MNIVKIIFHMKILWFVTKIGIMGTVLIISFEFFSFLGTKLQLFLVNDTPKFYKIGFKTKYTNKQLLYTSKPWGDWKLPNRSIKHQTKCFDYTLSTNEIGARDTSFEKLNKEAVFLLGDSFAEGWGVKDSETSQFYLEKILKKDVLNFGAAGDFGPLQYLMIYEHFKQKYKHQEILVYFLPSNDFTDNDAVYWEKYGKNIGRHRPYFSNKGNALAPFYFKKSNKKINEENEKIITVSQIKGWIVYYTYSSNVLRSISYLIKGYSGIGGYYNSYEYQNRNVISSFNKLVEIANLKPVTFVVIPTIGDIIEKNKSKDIYKTQLWFKGLKKLELKKNVTLIDLMDLLPNDYMSLFHTCDGHWSADGNEWAAKKIANIINNRK